MKLYAAINNTNEVIRSSIYFQMWLALWLHCMIKPRPYIHSHLQSRIYHQSISACYFNCITIRLIRPHFWLMWNILFKRLQHSYFYIDIWVSREYIGRYRAQVIYGIFSYHALLDSELKQIANTSETYGDVSRATFHWDASGKMEMVSPQGQIGLDEIWFNRKFVRHSTYIIW